MAFKRSTQAIASTVLIGGALALMRPDLSALQPQAPQTPPASPRAGALIDLTGYWVSVISEDWRWRMITPSKGDYASLPLNPDGRKAADAWDPARDEATGGACKAYGAAAIMRMPGRLHITWQDDQTLKIETDAGQQTRLLHFSPSTGSGQSRAQSRDAKGTAPRGERQWQGYSIAEWEGPPPGARANWAGLERSPDSVAFKESSGGTLKVVTTNLRAGYLRKNGVPYSENAVVTEHFIRFTVPTADPSTSRQARGRPDQSGGTTGSGSSRAESRRDDWFTVTTIVDDPTYLNQPFITSSNFKREPDGSKWRPTPCKAS
jgi:hypothetical protein